MVHFDWYVWLMIQVLGVMNLLDREAWSLDHSTVVGLDPCLYDAGRCFPQLGQGAQEIADGAMSCTT